MAKGKSKKPQNSKKAEAAYDEIDEGGFDLKALIAAQKGALAQKQAANTKKKKATAKTLLAAAQAQVKAQALQIAEMEKQVKAAKEAAAKAMAAAKLVAKDQKETTQANKKGLGFAKGGNDKAQKFLKCRKALDYAEAKIADVSTFNLWTDEIDKDISINLLQAGVGAAFFGEKAVAAKKAYVDRVSTATIKFRELRKLHGADMSETDKAAKAAKDADKRNTAQRFLGKFGRYANGVLSVRGTAMKGLSFLGGKLADKTKQPLTKMYEGIAKHAHSFMDSTPKTAQALRYVGGKVGALAANVKDIGSAAYSWIAKKLSFLGNMLRGFLKVPNITGGGTFSNLLGLAALLPTIIGPALAGINAELERRFGEHYIKDFISSMWDKAWGFLTDKVKQLLGIGDSAEQKSKAASDAMLANPTPENTKAASDAYGDKLQERAANSKTGFGNQNDPELVKFAELQKANPWSVQDGSRDRVKAAMQQQKDNKLGSNGIFGFFKNVESLQKIVDAAPEGAIDAAMEKELNDMGVVTKGRSGARRDGKQSTTPRLGTVPTSSSAPMDGAPVTAVPGDGDKRAPTGAGAGRGTGGSGGGITIPMVPNRMGSEIAPAIDTLHNGGR